MRIKTMRIFIKSYSILLAIIGSFSTILFFPSSQGCNNCLPYFFCGITLLLLSVGLFFLNNFIRKCMICFSCLFVGFFIFETIWTIKTDHTGQGLVGLVLLIPIFLICLFGGCFLFHPKTIKEFDSTT